LDRRWQADLLGDQVAALAPALGVAVAVGTPARVVADMMIAELGVTDRQWLLVFDNAVAPGQVLPFVPRGRRGHVIVTPRQGGWSGPGGVVEVDVLPREHALALLRLRVATVNQTTGDAICELLGDLPLAVEQAGAYLAETRQPAGQYLTALRTRARSCSPLGPPRSGCRARAHRRDGCGMSPVSG
jgi:hypothetical protein